MTVTDPNHPPGLVDQGEWVVIIDDGRYVVLRCSCAGVSHYRTEADAQAAADYLEAHAGDVPP